MESLAPHTSDSRSQGYRNKRRYVTSRYLSRVRGRVPGAAATRPMVEHGARSTQWKWSWLQGAANLGVVEVGSPSVKRNPVVLFSFRNKRDARSRNRPIVWVA